MSSHRVRGVDGSCAKHLTVESYGFISFPLPTHSFIPGLKPSFSANLSHCSLSSSALGLTTRIPQTFPDRPTSEHIRFYFLVFLFFALFSCRFRAAVD